jgi:transposase
MTIQKYLTTKEVAAELERSVATIYKYVQSKKLTPVYQDKWQIDSSLLFHPDDVEKLKGELSKPGLSVRDLAKKLDVYPSTINTYIQKGTLAAEKKLYRGKEQYFITEDEFNRFLLTYKQKKSHERKNFYSKTYDVYLFQSFMNEQGEKARIMELEGDTGIAFTTAGEVFPIEQLKSEGYKPTYTIEESRYITKKGYAFFRFPNSKYIEAPMYEIIESFFRHLSYKNVRLAIVNNQIELHVKPAKLNNLEKEQIELLQKSIVEGTVFVRHDGVYIDSEDESITIHISKSLKTELKNMAEQEELTLDELGAQLIKLGLEYQRINS